MAGLINLRLLTDFFNKIGQKRIFRQFYFGVGAAATTVFEVSNIGRRFIGSKFKILRSRRKRRPAG